MMNEGSPADHIKLINHVLYNIHGFSGNTTNHKDPQNSYLSQVLETKKGNQISLAIIYSVIAQKLDIPVYGVNLPQHFILAYMDETMESEFEMPVVMPLTQGTNYQFVFIGDYTSRLYEVRMFDWSEKQVIYQQKRWGDVDGNIISYGYIPRFSEFHMMKPVQVNKKKKKNLCGYVMLFKKAEGSGNTE